MRTISTLPIAAFLALAAGLQGGCKGILDTKVTPPGKKTYIGGAPPATSDPDRPKVEQCGVAHFTAQTVDGEEYSLVGTSMGLMARAVRCDQIPAENRYPPKYEYVVAEFLAQEGIEDAVVVRDGPAQKQTTFVQGTAYEATYVTFAVYSTKMPVPE